jgi:hypothetical protein
MRARFPIIERPLRELRPEQKKPPEALLGRVCTETGDCVFYRSGLSPSHRHAQFHAEFTGRLPWNCIMVMTAWVKVGFISLNPGRLHRHRGHGAFAQLRGERLPCSMKKVKPVFVSVQVSDA